ncbi:MAG: S1 RNA-binding domain-containing protein [Candidatus Saccharibacteria bacterium]|nr:S1 RNA-binding domain-containing protein [Candidatus Saccharibacteria bacterium]
MATKQATTMDELLKNQTIENLNPADVIEGTIVELQKHEALLDVGHFGIGIISRRELVGASSLKVGDKLSVSVMMPETKQGYVLLSLRRAMKEKSWEEIQKIYDNNQIVSVTCHDVNRGGLLVELDGMRGFLPISQLSTENYPRVNSSDRDEILTKLNALIDRSIQVCILDMNRQENKLIFSEKEALKETVAEQLKKLNVGDIVEGKVTGVIDFGAFVNLNGIEGLIHISEISWGRVEDPRKHIKNDEMIKVKIIAIDNERVALSLKQLSEDPWAQEVGKLKKGSEVEGVITRVTPYGAFVRLSSVVEALLYLTQDNKQANSSKTQESGNQKLTAEELENLKKSISVGEKKKFIVTDIDKTDKKIKLSLA